LEALLFAESGLAKLFDDFIMLPLHYRPEKRRFYSSLAEHQMGWLLRSGPAFRGVLPARGGRAELLATRFDFQQSKTRPFARRLPESFVLHCSLSSSGAYQCVL